MKFALVGSLLASAVLYAQPVVDLAARYEIQGRVLDADTGASIARAQVTLNFSPVRGQSSTPVEPVMVLTDVGGTFRIANIPAGYVNVSCQRPGYFMPDLPRSEGAILSLAQRKETTVPVTLYLRRHGVIHGTAIDESGAALPGMVQLFRLTLINGRRVPQQAGSASVDGEGAFRMAGLKPGRYYAVFSPFSTLAPSSHRAYRPVLYPGSADLAGARLLTVASGDDQQIDFRPVAEPGYALRVKTPAGVENASIFIQPASVEWLANSSNVGSLTWDEPEHVLHASGLPSGSYLIKANWMAGGVSVQASRKISLTGDAGLVTLEAQGPPHLQVSVRFEDPQAAARQTAYIQLSSAMQMFGSSRDANGNLSFPQLPAGVYAVQGGDGLGSIKAALQGGRDALHGGVLVPEEGVPDPLEVTMGTSAGMVEITRDPGLTEVIHVALLRQTAVGLQQVRETQLQVDNPVVARVRYPPPAFPLTPGEYVVIAWTGQHTLTQLAYNEPEFVASFGGQLERVKVGESGRQTVIVRRVLPATAFEEH